MGCFHVLFSHTFVFGLHTKKNLKTFLNLDFSALIIITWWRGSGEIQDRSR